MNNQDIYIGRDNVIALRLASDNVVIEHNRLSRCQVQVGTTLIDSATSPSLFDLTLPERLLLKFGQSALPEGTYLATLIVFDALHSAGLVWGSFMLRVRSGT